MDINSLCGPNYQLSLIQKQNKYILDINEGILNG